MLRLKITFVSVLVCLFIASSIMAQGVASPLAVRLQTVTSGLSLPILVTNAKDGTKRLFIVQQRGIIKVVQPGSNVNTDFMNIASKVSPSGSERGLLGLAFHPNFASNSYFFVNYTRASDGATVIARYTATNGNTLGDPNSEVIVLTIPQPFSNHNGGNIVFGPDGHLYIGMGDGGSANDPGARSQNINDLLGKMLRITPSVAAVPPVPAYTAPSDNPYVGVNGADEIYAIGLRNPWRWSFDRGGTNQLYAGDVGQDALEEVDIVTRGGNYGWRVYEGNSCTNLDPGLCTPANYTSPIIQYSHTAGRVSITGGYVYRGGLGTIPNGNYLYADYSSGEIFRYNGTTSSVLLDLPTLVSSFGEDEDGEIYICNYSFTAGGSSVSKLVRAKASADFDGDFKTDYSVFRASNNFWYSINSSNNTVKYLQFGATNDVLVPEDFDGDNITDAAVFRPSSGSWFAFRSSNNTLTSTNWGQNGDTAIAADYDGDAKADWAVFRPSNGTWYVLRSTNLGFTTTQLGASGDKPITGDFDGDGKMDLATFRPSTGEWRTIRSLNGASQTTQFGASTDTPVPGDYDNDGKTDLAVYRNGTWYIQRSTSGFFAIQFGIAEDIPTVGDYDGDGTDDIGVWRPSVGNWYLNRSTSGFVGFNFGSTGDLPVPSVDSPQ
jgi:glucose/arabinose dehydrogenase